MSGIPIPVRTSHQKIWTFEPELASIVFALSFSTWYASITHRRSDVALMAFVQGLGSQSSSYCQVHFWVDTDHSQWQSRISPRVVVTLPLIRIPSCPLFDNVWELANHDAKCTSTAFWWVSSWCRTTASKKIRRCVTREGRRLGCTEDLAPDPEEHLMIVFHDILL